MNIVYILTNEAMPGLIKIGATTREDVAARITELSSSTAIPLPFTCHFAGEIGDHPENVEKLLQKIFAKERINKDREFFRMDPETAVLALKLARVKDVTPQFESEPNADESEAFSDQKKRKENTNLAKYGINPGSELTLSRDPSIKCTVVEGNRVEYDGQTMSVSRAAVLALHKLGYKSEAYSGFDYWMYNDKTIWEIRFNKDNEQGQSE